MDRTTFPLGVALLALLAPTGFAHASPSQPALSGAVHAFDGGTLPPDAGIAPVSPKSGATLLGTVVVSDGKNLPPGVSVTLVSCERGDQWVRTPSGGKYSFTGVPVGKYDLKAEAEGVRTATQAAIQVRDGDTIQRDMVLEWDAGPRARISGYRAERYLGSAALAFLLIGMLITRWFKIVKPNHNGLLQYIESLGNRVKSHTDPKVVTALTDQLAECSQRFKPSRPLSRFLFWSQGEENATWCELHDIEVQLATGLAPEVVRTYLITAEPTLRKIDSDSAKALADEILKELQLNANSVPPANLPRQQQFLSRAMAMILGARDEDFIALSEWQNKSTWLALVGSILMVVLGAVEGNIMLFVAGAVGGLLSRMMRAIRQPEFSTDYGASWNTLFLSPLFGALSAWFGVGLITLLAHPKVAALGPLFTLVRWEHPLLLSTLTTAFLLGFSERLFDSLVEAAHGAGSQADSAASSKKP
jgi:hypothetical protein